MSVWKTLFIMLFGGTCLALALGTVVVPFSMAEGAERWMWLAGLLTATTLMGTLFTVYLRYEDRSFSVGGPRKGR
jgi:hypothetical protein